MINRYQLISDSNLIKDSGELREGENIIFSVKNGDVVTVKLFTSRVSEDIAQMQKNIASMNNRAAKDADPFICNCNTCDKIKNCKKNKDAGIQNG
jgi:hypothetical protein